MTLTANADVDRFVDQDIREHPVAAAVHIFGNAGMGLSVQGFAKPFVVGDQFIGLAYEEKDNTGGVDGDLKVRVFKNGDLVITLTGVNENDVGKAVYATADDAWSLSGHPDAFAGRVVHKHAANQAVMRLKTPGEKPLPSDTGHIEIAHDFTQPLAETGAAGAGAVTHDNGLRLVSALGLGVKNVAGANGGADLEVDAVAEIAQASIETAEIFAVSGGVTLDMLLHMTNIGDDAALDAFFGLVDGVTANSRLSMDHTDASDLVGFHMDGASANILAESDDNTTDVAAVDTTIDNVTTAGAMKAFKIIVRPGGICELYIDGVRILPETVFKVRSTAVLAAIINMEKTSNDTLGIVRIAKIRVAGART